MNYPLEAGKNFRLDKGPFSCNAYGTGHIHETYLLEAGSKSDPERYILQKLNVQVFKKLDAVQDNIFRILDYLKNNPGDKQGFRDLEMIETRSGKIAYTDNLGQYWRCFRFIENSVALERVETPEQAYEGGRSYGVFNARLVNYDPRRLHITIPHFMDIEWRRKQLTYSEFTNPGMRLKQAGPELKRVRKHDDIPDKFIKLRLALPDRVAHNDTKISNVLFDAVSGKGICVIDLDTVMTGTLITDYGDMVRSFTSSGKEDETGPGSSECREDVFRGLSEGFKGAVSGFISEVETRNLLLGAKAVIYMQAVRFLTDYLAGDVYYRTSYPEQNLFRARNQLGLLDSIISKEETLQQILDE